MVHLKPRGCLGGDALRRDGEQGSAFAGLNAVLATPGYQSPRRGISARQSSAQAEDKPPTTRPMTAFLTLLTLAFCTFGGKAIAQTIKDSADVESWLDIWWRGAAVSLALATLGPLLLGSPSCEEQDNRGCITYADDGSDATFEDRIDRGLQVLWKTVLGGTAGLVLLKREEEEKAKAEGRPVFPVPVNAIAGMLSTDPDRFANTLQVYCAGLAAGFADASSPYHSDFMRTGKTITAAVKLINIKPSEDRVAFAVVLEQARAYARPSTNSIFQSQLKVSA